MLPFSKDVWHTVPLLNYFQFPWRFLSLVIILSSFIAGAVIFRIKNKKLKIITCFILVFLCIGLSLAYTKPAYYHYRNDSHYLTRDNFIHGTNSQGDMFNTIWIEKKLPLKKQRIEISKGEGNLVIQQSKTSLVKFQTSSETQIDILANIAYFPGWKAYIDRKEVELHKTQTGIMTFSVPKGEHSVVMQFSDTMIRSVAKVIFFVTVIACLVLFKVL